MSYFYLASPYTSHKKKAKDREIEQDLRYGAAIQATGKLHRADMVVYSPIVHYHPIALHHKLPGDYDYWKHINEIFIQKSSGLIILTINGWKESRGVQDEIELAQSLKLPVMRYDPYETIS